VSVRLRLHACGWLAPFFGWHNDEHHHSNLALFTPADVFFGRVDEVRIVRQAALDAAYVAHPERSAHGPPRIHRPPTDVSINSLTSSAVTVETTPLVVTLPSWISQTRCLKRVDRFRAECQAPKDSPHRRSQHENNPIGLANLSHQDV
jgi:hypothetical protein